VDARVDVHPRRAHPDLEDHQTPQGIVQGRPELHGRAGIRDDHHVRGNLRAQPGQEFGQVRAADLLLSLDQHAEVHGKAAPDRLQGLQGTKPGPDLPLVVAGSAPVQALPFDVGFEGRVVPEGFVLGRLDIVMPVDEHLGSPGNRRAAQQHARVPRGLLNPGLQSQLPPDARQPAGAIDQVLGEGRIRRDGAATDQSTQAIQEVLAMFLEILQVRIGGIAHGSGRFHAREGNPVQNCKRPSTRGPRRFPENRGVRLSS